jgi:hypothetical protein
MALPVSVKRESSMRRRWRRAAMAVGVFAAAAAITLIGGAVRGLADTTEPDCTPPDSSRQFCVTVTDTDGVSVSGVSIPGTNEKTLSYMAYTITVENIALSGTLTNGTTTIKLKDNGSVSTAAFQASLSPAFCRLTSKPENIVTCSHGNLAADTPVTFTVVYISSTTAGTTATIADIVTAFREMLKGDPKGANISKVEVDPDPSTSYVSGDSAGSWSPTGNQVRLATDATDTQWSVLKFSNLLQPSFLSSLTETTVGPTVNCHPSLRKCIGENVHVELECALVNTCAISDTNFGFVQINIVNPDPGINENTVVVSHKLEDGSFELIDTHCTSNPPTTAAQLPCLIPTMTRAGGDTLLKLDVYFNRNGDFRPG